MKQIALVGRAAALGHEQEFVSVALVSIQLDLSREIGLGVLLLVHRERRQLRVAQVGGRVDFVHAAGDGHFVFTVGQHLVTALAHNDGCACVLAGRQHTCGGNIGIAQQLGRDDTVVGGRLRVVENGAQLLKVARTQKMRDVAHRCLGEQCQAFGLHLQEGAAADLYRRDVVAGQLAVRRGVSA